MKHIIEINAEELLKALKDASLYIARDNQGNATSYVLLGLNKNILSIIACDGRGYYENRMQVCRDAKPSLPGKPMQIFIPENDLKSIIKVARCKGFARIEVEEGKDNVHAVELQLPNALTFKFGSPVNLEVPDYGRLRKMADRGKKSSVTVGQVMLPVNELTRVGKVFPVRTGYTVPMFISKRKDGGLVTLLEYQAEDRDIKVIFMLGTAEAA